MSRWRKKKDMRAGVADELRRRKETPDDSVPETKADRPKRPQRNPQPTSHSAPAMQRLVPVAWSWNEEFARQLGTDKEGYYQVAELCGSRVITPEDAEDLYNKHNWWDFQRKIDERHVERLAAEMVVAVDISIAIGPDSFPRIVNGQHTLWAIVTSGRPIQASITVYMCRDKQAMANLYAIFDSNKTRSAATVIETQRKAGGIEIEHPASRHHKWSQAVACSENDFHPPKRQLTNRAKMQQASRPEVIDFAKWIERLIQNANQIKNLLPMGVAAGIYAMYRADPVRAEQFLKMYLSGAGLEESHPILILRNRMTIGKPEGEHGASVSRMHAEVLYTCWRKFCLNEPLLSTRRTQRLPAWDRWKVFISPTLPATLTLGNAQVEIEIARGA